jgi:hypothetical protein
MASSRNASAPSTKHQVFSTCSIKQNCFIRLTRSLVDPGKSSPYAIATALKAAAVTVKNTTVKLQM